MKTLPKTAYILAIASCVLSNALNAGAFALLGPFEPWMTSTNGFSPSNTGDIGGPMCISNEYRWNVPVLTYGFDQSFLKFFGTNGVAAVQDAIQILNDLPPASQIVSSNFPFYSKRINYAAASLNYYDLKSETLSLLLEQMGLAQPSRFVFVLRRWNPIFVTSGFAVPYYGYLFFQTNWVDGIIPYNIAERNYDSETLSPSHFVDGTFYDGIVVTSFKGISFVETIEVNPFVSGYSAVADQMLNAGEIYLGLTSDDAGGLRYLLLTNNVNYETMLPGIVGVGTNSGSLVNGAWRPGVEKITFVRHSVDSRYGAFVTMTNYFTDTYITNGVFMQQQVARTISQPDFLFSADNVTSAGPGLPFYVRTGTTNWLNNATLNGYTNDYGPGVIQGPVQIIFNKLGKLYFNGGSEEQVYDGSALWASFDASTNGLTVYPATQTGTNQMTVRLWLALAGGSGIKSFDWKPVSTTGAQYALQTSTNLTDWVTLFNLTNNGAISGYVNENPLSTHRFYRLISQ